MTDITYSRWFFIYMRKKKTMEIAATGAGTAGTALPPLLSMRVTTIRKRSRKTACLQGSTLSPKTLTAKLA
jgi:hypothetical protein